MFRNLLAKGADSGTCRVVRETTLETIAVAMKDLAERAADHVAPPGSRSTEAESTAAPSNEPKIEPHVLDDGTLPRRTQSTEYGQRRPATTVAPVMPEPGAPMLPREAAPVPSMPLEARDALPTLPKRSGASRDLGAPPVSPSLPRPSGATVDTTAQTQWPGGSAVTVGHARLSSLPRLPEAPAAANSTPAVATSRELPRSPVGSVPSMVLPGVAWVCGRLFMTVALAGVAHFCLRGFQRAETPMLSSELVMLAVLGALGFAGTAWWAMSLTLAARRLRLASIRPTRLGMAWMAPVVWTVAAGFLLRIEIRAEVDPMPAIVLAGFATTLAVPYLATAGVARSLCRMRPLNHWWLTVYLIDFVTFGVAGMVLSTIVVGGGQRVESWQVVTSALGAAASVVALLVVMMLAVGGPGLVRERIALLENRQAGLSGPTWFRTGFVPSNDTGDPAAAARPLLRLAGVRRASLAALLVWGVACMAASGVAAAATLTDWTPPASVISAVALAAVGGSGLWVALFGIWATAGVVNARRIRLVGSVAPSVLVVLTMPIPVGLALAGRVGGETGWTLAMVATLAGHLLLIATCRVLGTVMSHVRGNPSRFRMLSIMFALYTGLVFCAWLTVLPIHGPWDELGPIHLIAAGHALATMLLAWPVHRAMTAFDGDIDAAYSGRVSFRSTQPLKRRRPSLRRRGAGTSAPTVAPAAPSAPTEPVMGMVGGQPQRA